MKVFLSILLTFIIMNVGTLIAYGGASAIFGLQPPDEDSPTQFITSVLLVKIGMAFGFVMLFLLARRFWIGRWFKYAFVWWLMFAVVEIGQAVAPGYSVIEAGAGIVAEAIYFPLSAFIIALLLKKKDNETASA
jgi:hypothetical protein